MANTALVPKEPEKVKLEVVTGPLSDEQKIEYLKNQIEALLMITTKGV